MEHPIGHFVAPLYGETKHPKGAPKNGSYSIPKGVHETPMFLQCMNAVDLFINSRVSLQNV